MGASCEKTANEKNNSPKEGEEIHREHRQSLVLCLRLHWAEKREKKKKKKKREKKRRLKRKRREEEKPKRGIDWD